MSDPIKQEATLLKVYAISEARAVEQHEARMRELRASKRGLVVLLVVSAIQGLVALGLMMWAEGAI